MLKLEMNLQDSVVSGHLVPSQIPLGKLGKLVEVLPRRGSLHLDGWERLRILAGDAVRIASFQNLTFTDQPRRYCVQTLWGDC
jgi:hypothetical protein